LDNRRGQPARSATPNDTRLHRRLTGLREARGLSAAWRNCDWPSPPVRLAQNKSLPVLVRSATSSPFRRFRGALLAFMDNPPSLSPAGVRNTDRRLALLGKRAAFSSSSSSSFAAADPLAEVHTSVPQGMMISCRGHPCPCPLPPSPSFAIKRGTWYCAMRLFSVIRLEDDTACVSAIARWGRPWDVLPMEPPRLCRRDPPRVNLICLCNILLMLGFASIFT